MKNYQTQQYMGEKFMQKTKMQFNSNQIYFPNSNFIQAEEIGSDPNLILVSIPT
jgi:hypothetical protein